LLYKGYTIQPYSPAAGTGLSSHELNQPGTYRDVMDTTVVAQFKVIRDEASEEALFSPFHHAGDVFILAWTTTPWTLPANTALAVGKNIQYLLVNTVNPYTKVEQQVVLAKALFGKYFATTEDNNLENIDFRWNVDDPIVDKKGLITRWNVFEEFTGADLIGIKYERLFDTKEGFPHFEGEERAFRVINGDFVTTEDGTGIVHISPTFGADDFRAAQLADIPALMVPDAEGTLGPIVDRTGR